jgi:RNA polymerase sigma-70 factor, ECF subfamily
MQLKVFRRKEKELSDEELLARYLSGGDLEVLGTLYSRYMSMVYGVCLKYLRNRDDSRDAVISIFEKIAGEHGKHQPENFRAWLYVVTKNFCLMELRSAASAKTRHEEWSAEQEYFMEPEAVVHPIDKDQRETDKALQECIGKLVSMQRVAIELFYFGNKCYSEIAAELKTDEKRVKSLLQNGKRNLKICLEGSDVRY